jgi:hypothetical protein
MKSLTIAIVAIAVLAGACRREAPEYVPMKLGADATKLGADATRTSTHSR